MAIAGFFCGQIQRIKLFFLDNEIPDFSRKTYIQYNKTNVSMSS